MPIPGYYWPQTADAADDADALRTAFEAIGFEVCDNGLLEAGFDKVAVYADADGLWSHVAKQEDNGEWSSKLGRLEDVRHPTEHCFADSLYGNVVFYLRREMQHKAN